MGNLAVLDRCELSRPEDGSSSLQTAGTRVLSRALRQTHTGSANIQKSDPRTRSIEREVACCLYHQ